MRTMAQWFGTSTFLLVPAILCLGPILTSAQIVVPSGYSVEVVASGLDGPEGIEIQGSGQIAVCEARDAQVFSPFIGPGRLSIVHPSGQWRTLVTSKDPLLWIDVVRDPSRGYFVTTLGGFPLSVVRGIRQVHLNGAVSTFLSSSAHFTGITLNRQTGDLYLSRAAPNPGSIDRVAADGTSTVFIGDVRPEGLAMAGNGVLLATIQYRPTMSAATAFNEVVAFELETGDETVLAENLGVLVGAITASGTGEIFVSDYKDGKIRRLTPDGAGVYEVSEFASGFSTSSRRYPPNVPPHFGQSFNHLEFDSAGRLYVSDYGAGKIYVITGPF